MTKKLRYDGVEYPSANAAAKALNTWPGALARAIRNGVFRGKKIEVEPFDNATPDHPAPRMHQDRTGPATGWHPTLQPSGAYDHADLLLWFAAARRDQLSPMAMASHLNVPVHRIAYFLGEGRPHPIARAHTTLSTIDDDPQPITVEVLKKVRGIA